MYHTVVLRLDIYLRVSFGGLLFLVKYEGLLLLLLCTCKINYLGFWVERIIKPTDGLIAYVFDLQKMVLKVTIEDEKSKRRVMQTVAGVEGEILSINRCRSLAIA